MYRKTAEWYEILKPYAEKAGGWRYINQSKVAEDLGVDKSTVSKAIKRLEKEGIIPSSPKSSKKEIRIDTYFTPSEILEILEKTGMNIGEVEEKMYIIDSAFEKILDLLEVECATFTLGWEKITILKHFGVISQEEEERRWTNISQKNKIINQLIMEEFKKIEHQLKFSKTFEGERYGK